jgi:hypothetical protein
LKLKSDFTRLRSDRHEGGRIRDDYRGTHLHREVLDRLVK